MKYFIDTEFHERFNTPRFGRRCHTIDLISIGVVAEDGREYYAISKDFDIKKAWKDEWIRENILKPIHNELCKKVGPYGKTYFYHLFEPFTVKSLKRLLKWYGKTNREIATELMEFTIDPTGEIFESWLGFTDEYFELLQKQKGGSIDFYGYYADYDWIVFCTLFGRMVDLPQSFPMYCRDLKQVMDEKKLSKEWKQKYCPDPEGEHNALIDARWNKQFFERMCN